MENLDDKTLELINSLKQNITNATERLKAIDMEKAVADHIAMEELKEKIGVK